MVTTSKKQNWQRRNSATPCTCFPAPESGWSPKVLTYSGYYNLGIKEIWDMVGEYMEFTQKNGYFNYKRNEQAKYWMYESINDTLRETSTIIRR